MGNSFDLMPSKWKKTPSIYTSSPPEIIDSKQRLKMKLNDVDILSNSINNNKETITYFKKTKNRKRNIKKIIMLTTKIGSFDTVVIIATT